MSTEPPHARAELRTHVSQGEMVWYGRRSPPQARTRESTSPRAARRFPPARAAHPAVGFRQPARRRVASDDQGVGDRREREHQRRDDREPIEVALDHRGAGCLGAEPAAEHVRQAAALAAVQQHQEQQQ